ncbi:protein of unknown function [Tenacibaculum sp. 190524A02b]|uniref:Peptidylprolyl isomerase n=1 Tax=Tenacibaculum vairaonense TaxID=3137860 RepID=A0ABM9PH12_9FLAO
MIKTFSNKALVLGLVGTLTLGAINLTSDELISGIAMEINLNDNNRVRIQDIGAASYFTRPVIRANEDAERRIAGQDGMPGPAMRALYLSKSIEKEIAKLDK